MKTKFLVTGALPNQFDSREEAEQYIQKLHQMAEESPAIAAKLARFPINITPQNTFIDPDSVYHLLTGREFQILLRISACLIEIMGKRFTLKNCKAIEGKRETARIL